MSKATAAAAFFLIWWIVLFAVLPWGVHRQDEGCEVTPGTDPGAPAVPKIAAKLLWTTIIATIIFAAVYAVAVNRLVTIDGLLAPFDFHS